jgi:hypothetical protein
MELVYARSAKQGILKHRDKRLLIAVVASMITGAGLGEIFWPRVDATPRVEAVEPVPESSRRLPNEAAFEQTLRSCLGAACYTATPKGSKAEARIALLAPPSEAADAFFAWYVALAKRGGATARKVEWIQTAHAPPYGYGKNHGYTRIVRAARPVALPRVSCRCTHGPAHDSIIKRSGRCCGKAPGDGAVAVVRRN